MSIAARSNRHLVGPLLATLALAVSATPALAQECKPGKTGRIAFMLKQQTAFRYLNADVPFFKKTAEAAGYKVVVQSAENDANTQIAQAENVITQGVDAIVIQPVDFNVAGAIANLATKADIPLASYDDLILNAKHAAFIGRDPKEGGASAARAMLAKVPKGNYALIGGDPGQTGSTQMQDGYREVLAPAVQEGRRQDRARPVHAEVEDRAGAGARRERADAQQQQDRRLPGLVRRHVAGRAAGGPSGARLKAGSIPITGQDMELSAAQAIVEGRMFGSVWPAPDEMAVAARRSRWRWPSAQPIAAKGTINNKAGAIPWAKTPIYFVARTDMSKFVCSHQFWLKIDEVYKNAPGKKPTCKS